MRNLELVQCCRIHGISELKRPTCMSVDCDTGRVYLATSNGVLVCLDPLAQQVLWRVSLVEQGYIIADESSTHIVAIQHLPDQQSVCIATTSGDVLLYNTVMYELECVGSVASGLTNMTWSPDQELVVCTTGADTIILMTKDLDPVIETAAHPQEFGEQKPITVGWGKKETQFHGSEGKQTATQKAPAVKPALAWDDLKVRVSWRGDGQYFVVSAINPKDGVRKLRIWNRECVLQFTSEDVNGLEQALCWKPSGSLIVSSIRQPHKHDIVFFEKNGLRHGEFTLPFDKMQVKVNEVSWNTESSVLAVLLEDLNILDANSEYNTEESHPKSYIELWTVGNYHWYLKQSLHFPACMEERVVAIHWDPEHAYRLHIMCHGGQYLQYTWSWATNHSQGHNKMDNANVAVIDGKQILITPFRKMVVPPPMAAYSLQLAEPVNQVLFAPSPHSNNVAAVMHDGRIAFYTAANDKDSDIADASVSLLAAGGNGFKVRVKTPLLKGVFNIIDYESGKTFNPDYPMHLHHFYWVQPDTILAASTDPEGAGTTLYHISIKDLETELVIRSQNTIYGEVFRICSHPNTGRLAIQLTDGTVVNPDNQQITQLPQPCVHMAMCTIGGQEVVLGLTERYRFYVNDKEVASNCSSFAVHDEFLLLTTHSHTCRAISLNTSLTDLYSLSQGKSVSLDETIRHVERGSRIVIAVPDDTKLILQMPRGNLEAIHPRPLVLSAAKKLLDKLEYQKAFDLLRRHRISMNLICDHNPKKFLETLDNMVSQLDSANNLNLFVTDLKEEDVTETIYSAAYREEDKEASETVYKCNKVDVVCDAVRNSIYRVDQGKYFLSTLTTHVKKTCPELETALQKIQFLRDHPSELTGAPTADEALRYILYLVDVNELFDVALGTYDFSLVIMVAEKSQKDPKEYLPFLNQLQKLESNYQRFSIDLHLKRYSKALQHISQCPDHFPECLALVKEHKLYSQAMKLFTQGSLCYKDIVTAYAEYLSDKKHTAEAALMYSLCEEWDNALDLYKSSGQWQQVFCMANQLGYKEDQLTQLANSVAVSLMDTNRHSEAAVVLLEYANDVEEAIVTLITGQQWNEALRVMHKCGRLDFIETNLKPALTESCDMYKTTLENHTTTFVGYRSRLGVVRQLKEQARIEMIEGRDLAEPNADLYSDTSSITGSMTSSRSGYTAYSSSTAKIAGRSSKNRRKAERKKHSLREGSAFEDVALLEALGGIIKNVDNLKGDFGKLLAALVLHGYSLEAGQLQTLLGDTLKMMDKSIAEIWQPDIDKFSCVGQSFGPQSTSAAIAAAAINQSGTRKLPSPDDLAIFVPPKISKDETWKMHVLDTR